MTLNKQAQVIISDIRLKHGSGDVYSPIIRWDEFEEIAGALESAEKRIAELEHAQSLHGEDAYMLCGQFDELAAAMGWTSEIAVAQGVSQLEYARNLKARIAELEARNFEVTIPHDSEVEFVADRCNRHRKNKRNAALRAAGIKIKGE